jgi:hypothetical protein
MFKTTLWPSNICLQEGFQKVQTISTKVLKEKFEAAKTKGHVGQQKSQQRQEKEELSCAPSPKSKHRASQKKWSPPTAPNNKAQKHRRSEPKGHRQSRVMVRQ